MQRRAGLPIEALIEYMNLFQQGDDISEARKEILLEQRKHLVTRMEIMQKTLERMNHKIERYEQIIVSREKELKRSKD